MKMAAANEPSDYAIPARPDVNASTITAAQMLNAQTSPFLYKMPAEIRNAIYRAALIGDGDITVTKEAIRTRSALLKVSAQVRQEAKTIFYTENAFTIDLDTVGDNLGVEWLSMLGEEQTECLSNLKFTFQNTAMTEIIKDSLVNATSAGAWADARDTSVRIINTAIAVGFSIAKRILRLSAKNAKITVMGLEPPRAHRSITLGGKVHNISILRMCRGFLMSIRKGGLNAGVAEGTPSAVKEWLAED